MDRYVVIANPVASQFTGGAHRDVMASLSDVGEVTAVWPSSAQDASARATEAARSGVNTIVAMGGDGIVHHVAQGLVGTPTRMGIIPTGTTNVFARFLGIPQKPQKAAKMLATDSSDLLLGTAEMQLTRGDIQTTHHAIFACGLGLDAAIVSEADKDPFRKYRFGSLHYASTAVKVALKYQKDASPLEITDGRRSAQGTSMMLQFRSVYSYFGRINLQLADEEPNPMTALIAETVKRRRVPRIAITAITGRELSRVKDLSTWSEVDRIEVHADEPVPCQADGESLGQVDDAVITWQPSSLRVAVPQSED